MNEMEELKIDILEYQYLKHTGLLMYLTPSKNPVIDKILNEEE